MAKKVAKKKAAKAAAPSKKAAKKTAPAKKKATKEKAEEADEPEAEKPAKKEKAGKKAKGASAGSAHPEKTYQTIKDLMLLIDEDIDKFLVNETRAAGRRIRGYAQQIRKACAQFRKEIQAVANERKGK